MEKSRQQRRAEERRKEKLRASDAKAKVQAIRRVAQRNARREPFKRTVWQWVGLVLKALIERMFDPILFVRDLLFPERSRDRSRTRR
jgi:hypothetical protein